MNRIAAILAPFVAALALLLAPASATAHAAPASPAVPVNLTPTVVPAPAESGTVPGSMMLVLTPEQRAAMEAYALATGDDNGDGRITDDESGFNCWIHGNSICGPGALTY